MRQSNQLWKHRSIPSLAAAVAAVLSVAPALAASGSWDENADGDWSVPGNWTGGTVADGADSTATFGNFINADRTVNVDGPRTIGNLHFQDVSHRWIVGSTSADALTLDVAAGAPLVTVNASAAATISATVAGNDGLTTSGSGTLRLAGANSYSGVTTLGTIDSVLEVTNLANAGAASSIGVGDNSSDAANAGSLIFNKATTLRYLGSGGSTNRLFTFADASMTLDASGSGAVNFTNTGQMAFGGSATSRSFVLRGANTGDNTLSISATAPTGTAINFNKDDAGKWIVNGNFTSTGGQTNINQGTLVLAGNITMASGNYIYRTSGSDARLVVSGNNTLGFNSVQIYKGDFVVANNAAIGNGGNVMLGAGNMEDAAARFLTSGAVTIGRNVEANGPGTLVVGGETANTSAFNGVITLGRGVGRDVELTAAAGGTVNINGNLAGRANAIATSVAGNAISTTGNHNPLGNGEPVVFSGNVPGGITAGVTYYVINAATGTFQVSTTPGGSAVAINSTTTDFDYASGAYDGGINKTGAGLVKLNNTKTYAGNTTVSGGTLALVTNTTSNIANSAVISVADGATLDVTGVTGAGGFVVGAAQTLTGSGTIVGAATVNGTVSPGASPGILETGNLAINGELVVDANGTVAGTGHDQLDVTGTVALGAAANLDFLLGYAPGAGDSFTIIANDAADAVAGTFATVNGAALLPNNQFIANYNGTDYTFDITYEGGDGNDVVIAPIPEPTTLAPLALLSLAAVRRRRRCD